MLQQLGLHVKCMLNGGLGATYSRIDGSITSIPFSASIPGKRSIIQFTFLGGPLVFLNKRQGVHASDLQFVVKDDSVVSWGFASVDRAQHMVKAVVR